MKDFYALKVKFSEKNEEAENFMKEREVETILKLLDEARQNVIDGKYHVEATCLGGEVTLTIK